MIERGQERIHSVSFTATIPQILGWMHEAGAPSSPDSVRRAVNDLAGMGVATLRVKHIHEGSVRLAGQWHFDFGCWFPDEVFEISFAQTASLLESTNKTKTKATQGKQSKSKASVHAEPASCGPEWQGCLEALRMSGERVEASKAQGVLSRSGVSPEQALLVLQGAMAQGRKKRAEGREVERLVGYALKAVALPSWRESLLSSARPAQALPAASEVPNGVNTAAVALLQAEGFRRGDAEKLAISLPLVIVDDPLAAVQAAVEIAHRPGRNRPIGSFPALITSLLRSPDKDLTSAFARVRGTREELNRHAVGVPERIREHSDLVGAWASWKRHRAIAPSNESPGWLDHVDSEREKRRRMVKCAEAKLGQEADQMRATLRRELLAKDIAENGDVWHRVWTGRWEKVVCESFGISC
jgi:hypothetical protein